MTACSAATRAERAAAAHWAHGPADRLGVHQPVASSAPVTRTIRTPGAVNQRAIRAVSSTSAPPSGAGCGRITCAPAPMASTTGIGGTPRRAVP
ncbi:hypothetical protein, partial [Mycobacterium cookii]|uniref:hypothetical protein n=1 Tax=Mycobacterium cookii TaxID=1775 RepID=UPI0021F37090